MELPGGRYLHLTTRERGDDHLRVHLLLNEGNRPVINTVLRMDSDSVILLGGPKDENGTLIITISAEKLLARPGPSPLARAGGAK